MAQTTGGMSFKDCKIETSPNGSSWTDMSGFFSTIEVGGGERKVGEAYTFSGNYPIVMLGKMEPLEITVKGVYTEGASDLAETVRAAYEGGTALYLRWSPKGGTSTNFQYTTGIGYVTAPAYPAGEAETGDVAMIEFTVRTNTITKSVVA